MNRILKENKVILFAVAAVLCITVIMAASTVLAQGRIEQNLSGLSQEDNRLPEWNSILFKDMEYDSEVAQEVCKKYDLDYDTVTLGEITREMFNYEHALWLKKDEADSPLLGALPADENGELIYSLEVQLDDVYAFQGSAAIIAKVCSRAGIDSATATIDDLTVDELMQIMEEAYWTSDHDIEGRENEESSRNNEPTQNEGQTTRG